MTIRTIYIGQLANDGTGDNLRSAFDKVNQNFIELYNLTGDTQTISVAANGNTLVKRDAEGSVYANKIFYANEFTSLAALPVASDHSGMLVYVQDEGFRASNGTDWVKNFGTHISTQHNGFAVGTPNKIRKLNFNGSNITVTADPVDVESVNISVDQQYTKTVSTTSTSSWLIDSFSVLAIKAAKYLVHVTTGSDVYFTEINVLHTGTGADITEYSSMGTAAKPGEFTTNISAGQIELIFTPIAAVNTVRITRFSINS